MFCQRAGDFFMTPDDIADAIPNGSKLFPFAKATGVGLTWAFGQYAHVYRTDLTDPNPTTFESYWEDRFAGKRATYITSNTLQVVFFLASSAYFGKDEYDMEAGFKAMKAANPVKLSDFTGNMQTLVERGEVEIGVQWEGEVYLQMDKDIPVAPIISTNLPFFASLLVLGICINFLCDRYCPVILFLFLIISLYVPCAITSPPLIHSSGPKSII